MKADQPDHTDENVRTGLSRRRLFSSGAIMLLGVSAIARSKQNGGAPGAGRQAGGSPGAEITATRPPPAPSGAAAPVGRRPTTAPPIEVGAPPAQQRMAPQYYIDDAGPQAIALTLDDGPHPVYTPQVLEVLDQYGISATFNMVGSQIAQNLALVREVAAAGHTITNHTWDHADMRGYTTVQVISEIDRCNDTLADAGQSPEIFRAPFGYWTPSVFQACAARGLTPLGWSVDPQDWDTAHVTTWDIVNTVLRTTRPHDIILEHDGGGNRSNTVAALRIFIPALLERGFVFAAV